MNPIYKFELTINGATERSYPLYGNDLSKDFELQSNQQFFRAKLSGKLTFTGNDYSRIMAAAFDTQFGLEIFISYDAGQTWASYWIGEFWKTDCDFDEDSGTVVVTPTVRDQYTDVLAGLEKEYNLIDLLPEIVPVKYDKRPMIQVYVPGDTVIACFLSGMWWEQECEPVEETDVVNIGGTNYPALTHKYYFSKNTTGRIVEVSGNASPELPPSFVLTNPGSSNYFSINNGTYTFYAYRNDDNPSNQFDEWYITRNSDNRDLWYGRLYSSQQSTLPYTVTLEPVSGSGATGTVTVYVHDINVYARYILDVPSIAGVGTYELPIDDLVANNRNYKRVIGYGLSNVIYFSSRLSSTPTKWGIYQPGQYYVEPYLIGSPEMFPISRNNWSKYSIWFSFSAMDWVAEQAGRASFTLKDAFPLSSVISVLLNQIAPGITHEATTDYSVFLYSTNPITSVAQTLMITPKSNVIYAGYDQPAQKAPIKLKDVLDMLRDCFRCYWFIDGSGRFRIEHINYFMRGGSYYGDPEIGIDLTALSVYRTGKSWATGRNQYQFDKPEMTARYQFGWMDDVTELFDGYPIDILSKWVDPEKIEQINVTQFTSDIDYILLNPSVISKDGFVLLCTILQSGEYTLPYYNFQFNGSDHLLQNAYAAFIFLQRYYAYDMPAPDYSINGVQMVALGTKRLKTQTLKFPTFYDPDTMYLVKTNLGNGAIQKISVNLSSRNANATLKYDTE